MNTDPDPQPAQTTSLPPASPSTTETTSLPPASPSHSGATTASSPSPNGGATRPPTSPSLASTEAAAASFRVHGYEILGELGRGGMGVVYKARQTALKRLVAVKVIRAAAQAGPDELQRFRVEAEAVARLQHQHIVQIYEVGEQEGTPYCVLEFVDGGSLAQKLADKPLPSDEAARLLEALARAVAYAHQRQVIHRDLKPANVLLTAADEPKITDFGLAKQLDDDSCQTRTGQIMGTPSYMAPEQAAGDQTSIGPRTDVYALGAILYEMLAGQPPFKGPNVAVTLQLVQTQDPTPPTRLNPKTPRDLETICLKCLQKDPARRYGSALQMAQDLERFRNGEAILARPENVVRKLVRKLRRRWPLVAAGVALTVALVVGWFAFSGGRSAWRASELGQQLEAGLAAQPADWSGGHVEQQEGRIAELTALAPQRAAGWRDQLHQKFGEAVAARIRQPRLEADERDRIEALLREYAKRWPDEERELRGRFEQRLSDWQDVLTVAPPFTDWEKVFPGGVVMLGDKALIARQGPAPVVLTAVGCQGNEEVEATWDDSWGTVPAVGLLLNADAAGGGYEFLLSAAADRRAWWDTTASDSLAEARRKKGKLYLQIRRNSECLREELIDAPAEGPLRLRARRDGDLLEFQVGDLAPLRFRDDFALAVGKGAHALYWPAAARVTSVQCRRQTRPPAPSPLEQADDLYFHGQFVEALAAYEREGATVGPEARYKAAVCLTRLNRADEALDRLERVAAQEGERWPLLAGYRLVLAQLDKGQTESAEDVLHALTLRGRREDAALLLPDKTVSELYARIVAVKFGLPMMRADAAMADRVARTLEDLRAMRPGAEDFGADHALSRCRWMAGQTDLALQESEAWLKENDRPEKAPWRMELVKFVLLDRTWLLEARGKAETRQALAELDHWLPPPHKLADQDLPYSYIEYRVEHARLNAALEDWPAVEQDLGEALRLMNDPKARVFSYLGWSGAQLMEGFLCERRGDKEGMLRAWKQGTFRAYRERYRQDPNQSLLQMFNALFMEAECGELDDARVAQLRNDFFAANSNEGLVQLVRSVDVPPAVIRNAFRSPRAVALARQAAFHTVAFPDFARGLVRLGVQEYLREEAFGTDLTADQDELTWRLTGDILSLYVEKKLGNVQQVQLGLTWKGITGFLGWASVAPKLPPDVRGPLAYVFGFRLLRRNQPADAAAMFRTALADAPADSSLRRLAQAELDRLKAK